MLHLYHTHSERIFFSFILRLFSVEKTYYIFLLSSKHLQPITNTSPENKADLHITNEETSFWNQDWLDDNLWLQCNSFYWSWEKLTRNSTTSKWRIPFGQDYTNSWHNWKQRCNLLDKEESSLQHHSCIPVKEHCIFGGKKRTCSNDRGQQNNTCVQERWT